MTEIPEHLLKRSKERRAAIGQSDDAPAAEATPTTAVERSADAPPAASAGAAAPATVVPGKAPAVPTPPPVPPARPEVAAALRRKKIPHWAVPALVALPFWALLYASTLDPVQELSPVIAEGQQIYGAGGANCAGCHGGEGGGGVGPAFGDNAVIATFPDYTGQVEWITLGAATGAGADGGYGDPARVGGQHNVNDLPGVMPGYQGSLSEEEILAVTRYEREVLSGYGCEPALAEATGEACAPGTEAQTAAG